MRVYVVETKKQLVLRRQEYARGSQLQRSSWFKPREDMDKHRSCANCGSANHHVADCTRYKQGMKSSGYTPEEEDVNQMEEHQIYSGLIIKIGARCFFCNQEGHGLSFVLGGGEESESPETQTGTDSIAKY